MKNILKGAGLGLLIFSLSFGAVYLIGFVLFELMDFLSQFVGHWAGLAPIALIVMALGGLLGHIHGFEKK